MLRIFAVITVFFLSFSAFSQEKIQWLGIEKAFENQSKQPRFMFIDLYTDWCGWCKVMDRSTFVEDTVSKFFKNRYYNVKFNAESTDTFRIMGNQFKYMEEYRMNELALSLFNGQSASFPSFVVLGPGLEYLGIIQGYQKSDEFIGNLVMIEQRYIEMLEKKKLEEAEKSKK